jgi:cell cycle arrest protein BUB3
MLKVVNSFLEMSETSSEFVLKNGPDDGISAVKFGPHSNQLLLVSSWDSSVRLYDVQVRFLKLFFSGTGLIYVDLLRD